MTIKVDVEMDQILLNFSQGIKLSRYFPLHFKDGKTEVREVT